jgi:hypothetical protein
MLTDQEWQDLNRRIFTNHPTLAGGWKPGRMCDGPRGFAYGENRCRRHKEKSSHEIPPPDLRENSIFVRVLESRKHTIFYRTELEQ